LTGYKCIIVIDEKFLSLKNVVDIHPGYPFRGAIKDFPDGNVRVVQMRDVDKQAQVDWATTLRTELPGKRKPVWLLAGDVIFLLRGSHNIAIHLREVPAWAVISPHFFLLRIKEEGGLLPAFLAWQMNQRPAQRYFNASAEGTFQRSIRRAVLEDLRVNVPPLDVQERVLDMAETATKEIAVLKKLIANREDMMDAIASNILNSKHNRS